MSKHVITLEADSICFTSANLMSEKNTGSVVITDNDKIVGIITARDLIKLVCAPDKIKQNSPT